MSRNIVMLLFYEMFALVHLQDARVPGWKYPCIVILRMTKKDIYCTGALLTPSWVLTPAHCVESEDDSSIKVFVRGGFEGDGGTNGPFQEIASLGYVVPWGYRIRKTFGKSDIALVDLGGKFNWSSVPGGFSRCSVPTATQARFRTVCTAVGHRERNPPADPDALTTYHLLVQKPCLDSHRMVEGTNHLYRTWVCQDDLTTVDQGFSQAGAVLFCGGVLRALAVGQLDTPGEDNPGPLVFTDICPYLSWIRSYVGPSVVQSPGDGGAGCYTNCVPQPTPSLSVLAAVVILIQIKLM